MKLAAILFAVALCGCSSIPVSHGIPNLQVIDSRAMICCGGTPNEGGRQVLKAMGVRYFLNLDTVPDPVLDGVTMVHIPITGYQQQFGLVGSQLEAAYAFMLAHPGAVYVHCKHGMNRTRTFVALWRMRHDGWSWQRAVAEANEFGWGSSFEALKEAVRGQYPVYAK